MPRLEPDMSYARLMHRNTNTSSSTTDMTGMDDDPSQDLPSDNQVDTHLPSSTRRPQTARFRSHPLSHSLSRPLSSSSSSNRMAANTVRSFSATSPITSNSTSTRTTAATSSPTSSTSRSHPLSSSPSPSSTARLSSAYPTSSSLVSCSPSRGKRVPGPTITPRRSLTTMLGLGEDDVDD